MRIELYGSLRTVRNADETIVKKGVLRDFGIDHIGPVPTGRHIRNPAGGNPITFDTKRSVYLESPRTQIVCGMILECQIVYRADKTVGR